MAGCAIARLAGVSELRSGIAIRTVVLILLVGTVALALAACGGSDDEDEVVAGDQNPTVEAADDPDPTATPEPEPEPTSTPQPSPTPEPTATPEPTPTPTPEPEPEAMCPERGDEQWIYATNSAGHRIHVFDMEGTEICYWGEHGSSPGEFNEPIGISTDSEGNVYVADSANGRVQIFTDRGAYLDEWGFEPEPGYITHVAVSPSGAYLYIADPGRGRLRVLDVATMETVGELDHEVMQSARALTPWEGDTAALSLPGGLFIVEPSSDNQILFSPADGVLPGAAIQIGGGQSLIVLDVDAGMIDPDAATTLSVMDEEGRTTNFVSDVDGSQVLFTYNDQVGLGLGREGQLVLSQRSDNLIGVLSLDDLPTIAAFAIWQLESVDPDTEADLRLIAVSP